jgi:uncharacterized membrane protein
MAAGLPIAMIPLKPYEDATRRVSEQVFTTGSAVERANAARRLRIDYVWAGAPERHKHPDLVEILDSRSDLFAPVFRNGEVVVYWVTPADTR